MTQIITNSNGGGAGGGGGDGDMKKSVYDPQNIAKDAFDYDNFTNTPTIPTDTSDLTNGAGFITSSALSGYQTTSNLVTNLTNPDNTHYPSAKAVSDAITAAGGGDMLASVYDPDNIAKNAFDYDNFINTPTIPAAQIQSDWDESDNTKLDYIKNKPTIPTVNNSTIEIQKNGTKVDDFTLNQASGKNINITVPTDTSDLTNGAGYITGIDSTDVTTALGYTPYNNANPDGFISGVDWGDIGGTLSDQTDLDGVLGNKANKSDVLEKTNTTAFTPSGDYNPATKKYVDDAVADLMGLGKFLSLWDATTGQPISFPLETPYTYTTGDYFLVETISSATPPVNYKPTGSSYTGTASSTAETEELEVGDIYIYDGTTWLLQVNHGKTVSFSEIAGSPSDNTALSNALAAKANDNAVVKLTGDQTIAGTKTFSTSPIVPSKTSDATNTGTAIATEAQVYKKQDALTTQTAYTSKGTSTKVPTITTNTLGQVTAITETSIAFPVTSVNNQTGAVTVNDTKVASSAPTATEGTLWYDSANDKLKAYNGSSWDEIGGGITKVFTLSGTTGATALAEAQAAYDWWANGGNPILKKGDLLYTLSDATSTQLMFSNVKVYGSTSSTGALFYNFGLEFIASSGTVTTINSYAAYFNKSSSAPSSGTSNNTVTFVI